jgi:hypothetical protein
VPRPSFEMFRLELRGSRPVGHARHMDNNDDNTTDQRQARLEVRLEEFRAAQHRRLVARGIALWNRTAARAALADKPAAPGKLN